jgi:hypothetical protein
MAMFGARHYVWLASACRDIRREIAMMTNSIIAHEASDVAINFLATSLASENEGFDRERFIRAIFNPTED